MHFEEKPLVQQDRLDIEAHSKMAKDKEEQSRLDALRSQRMSRIEQSFEEMGPWLSLRVKSEAKKRAFIRDAAIDKVPFKQKSFSAVFFLVAIFGAFAKWWAWPILIIVGFFVRNYYIKVHQKSLLANPEFVACIESKFPPPRMNYRIADDVGKDGVEMS